MSGTTQAGWYDDGSGATRWWDGARWTEHVQPAAQPAGQAQQAQQTQAQQGGLSESTQTGAVSGQQARHAAGGGRYVVLQVAAQSPVELEDVINAQADLGYRLHTTTTASSSGSQGFGGGDRAQATLVFEKL